MKKILATFFVCAAIISLAQGPIIEATYFPVRNTMIKQVWDITNGSLAVPASGPSQVWDYRFSNGQFLNIADTSDFKFLDPSTSQYASYFPSATHVTFIRTPLNNLSDSIYAFWEINRQGMFYLGGYNIQTNIDSSIILTKKEFYAPNKGSYLDSIDDTSYVVGYAKNYNNLGYRAKIKTRKIKTSNYAGYGTLHLPNGSFNDVALLKEKNHGLDSVFVDFAHNGNYSFFTTNTSSSTYYQFMRNNTFGSNLLMYLVGNYSETSIDYGWYTLPVDIGSISGDVYTSTSETSPVADGEMYLYRENSNFTKNDVLAKTAIQANGSFQFDSIPYGEYRIAARPNDVLYPNSKITYYSDTTNWIDATAIITTSSLSAGHKIHLQYHSVPVGTSSITGVIGEDWNYNRGTQVSASIPVPGVGVVVKKHPGNTAARVITTDSNGGFDLSDLDDGDYSLFVDIPGMHMTGTYSFTVLNGSSITDLNFTVGNDSIHPFGLATIGIKENGIINSKSNIVVYPSIFNQSVTVESKEKELMDCKIEVFNIIGEKQNILAHQILKGRKYILNFNNTTSPNGIYFVHVSDGTFSEAIQVIKVN